MGRQRVGPAGGAPRLRLRLLGAAGAWLDGEPVHLSPRHAEILALLVAHPQGLSAEAVSAALGPEISSTSVRSEVSRLRRLLGACLATRPYRLVADLDADLLELTRHLRDERAEDALALAGDGLLPRSRAPGVVRLREGLDDDLRAVVGLAMRDAGCNPLATFDARECPP